MRPVISGGAGEPSTHPHDEERPHRCGRCANPFTGGNPNCPNARKDHPLRRILDDYKQNSEGNET